MRTKIGIALLALSVPYVAAGLLLGWESLAMGATALIVSGGVMIARGARRKRAAPGDPAIPKPPRTPTIPPPVEAPDEPATTAPAPDPRPESGWREGEVILPPPPVPNPSGPAKLTLIHSDGRRIDVRDYRRRAAGSK